MKKNIFKSLILVLLAFSLVGRVNAVTGNYGYKNTTYCFNRDGSYAATKTPTFYSQANIDDGCSGYFKGTIVKTINGQDAYCAQSKTVMSLGSTCTMVSSYNQSGWMNGHWTEANAIKVGYAIEYIKSKGYGHAREYVYIVNAVNDILQFEGSADKRTLASEIQSAIDYANSKYTQFSNNKTISGTPIKASMTSTLTNVGVSYSVGEVDLVLANSNALTTMNVTASCSNCKLYTDSSYATEFTGVSVPAGQSKNVKLYAKTNGRLATGTKVDVTVKGTFSDVSYPITKLWDCGSGRQSVVTLAHDTLQFSAGSATTSSVVSDVKVCKVEDGKYYGKNGTEVKYEEYKKDCLKVCVVDNGKYYNKDGKEVKYDEYKKDCLKVCKVDNGKYYNRDGKEVKYDEYKKDCLKICKVEDGKYFGVDGTEITESQYRNECLPSVTVNVPSTGSNGSVIPAVIGSLFVIVGLGSIQLSKKKQEK